MADPYTKGRLFYCYISGLLRNLGSFYIKGY